MYHNKVVLITGASRGVGLAVSKHFLQHGATVIGLSRGTSTLEHERYFHFPVDLGDPDAVTACFRKEISKQFRTIDIVINNAAVMTSQYTMILPVKNAVEMVNVNLLGVFFVSREAAKLMRKNDYGRIVNIGSIATSIEPAGDALYAATKAGIMTLANTMAKEYASFKVTCNTVCISAIETDMLFQHSETGQAKIRDIIHQLPVPRMANDEDVLNVIDFFVSEKSSYITAQTIYLGGVH